MQHRLQVYRQDPQANAFVDLLSETRALKREAASRMAGDVWISPQQGPSNTEVDHISRITGLLHKIPEAQAASVIAALPIEQVEELWNRNMQTRVGLLVQDELMHRSGAQSAPAPGQGGRKIGPGISSMYYDELW